MKMNFEGSLKAILKLDDTLFNDKYEFKQWTSKNQLISTTF